MAERISEQELYEFAQTFLPAPGQSMLYTDFDRAVRASAHPEAISFYRRLKKQGVVTASLSVQPDGTIKHEIQRKGL